jgi:hypothetical protein
MGGTAALPGCSRSTERPQTTIAEAYAHRTRLDRRFWTARSLRGVGRAARATLQVDVVVDASDFPLLMRIGMFVLTALPFKWLRALGVHEVAPLSYFRLWSVEVCLLRPVRRAVLTELSPRRKARAHAHPLTGSHLLVGFLTWVGVAA